MSLGSLLIIVLLIISSCAYVGGLFVLLTRRCLPAEVAPPRTASFVALVLCAAKAILGQAIASLQLALSGLILVATIFALWSMCAGVWKAFKTPEPARSSILRWSVILIPPLASIGLLGILDTLPEQDVRMLIYGFIVVNFLPALFFIATAKSLLSLDPFKASR